MKTSKSILLLFLVFISCCKNEKEVTQFKIAFGSCNNQVLENNMWNAIAENKPSVWIWGGDIIYSDTEDMLYMEQNYQKQKKDTSYSNFIKTVDVLGTWDDHDYGLNDGGQEYNKKNEAQQLFLNFFDVPKNDKRRTQKGIYSAKDYVFKNASIKIIVLDTRYFRSSLTIDSLSNKRYTQNTYGNGTILGNEQWNWLENQLQNSTADYHIIVSSIQFLSSEHGFETWGNMPHEVEKLENLLKETNIKNAMILSGDRHISEISKKDVDGLNYPLIDFTSSGMTHSYTNFSSEPNKYRIVDVVSEKSFGILIFDFNTNTVEMEIRTENNKLLSKHTQKYF